MSRYVLEQRIGDGGMAEVFRARIEGPQGFQRVCAVKRLLPELRLDASLQMRFIDEARITGRLRHPCIVDVLDFYEEDGAHHLVMELVDGVSAETLVGSGDFLPLPVIGAVILATARALQHAHAQGVLHRDVSACNVLVSSAGEIKLADFGLADAVGRLSHTEPGSVAGKLAYMSPARRRGEPATPADDLYALGIVLQRSLGAADPRQRASAAGRRWIDLQQRLLAEKQSDSTNLIDSIRKQPVASPEEVAAHVDRVTGSLRVRESSHMSAEVDDPTLLPHARHRT